MVLVATKKDVRLSPVIHELSGAVKSDPHHISHAEGQAMAKMIGEPQLPASTVVPVFDDQ